MHKQFVQSFQSIEWKAAIKTGLSGSLGLYLGLLWSAHLYHPDTIISGMWSALSAIVVQQGHLGSTYKSAWIRFLGMMIGCTMGGLFTTLMGSNPISLTVGIILTVVICSLFGIKDSVRIACLSVAIVMILWGLRPGLSPWQFGFFRFLDSCIGIAAAVLVAHLLWPAKVATEISHNVAETFQSFSRLFMWASYLKPLTPGENQIFYQLSKSTGELLRKNHQYLEDSKLELISESSDLDEWKLLFDHLDAVNEKIYILKNIYKEKVGLMVEAELNQDTMELVQSIEKTMQQFARALLSRSPSIDLVPLQLSSEKLSDALLGFRSKKITRQYELQDVESFFVYFFTLKALVHDLEKCKKHIDKIK